MADNDENSKNKVSDDGRVGHHQTWNIFDESMYRQYLSTLARTGFFAQAAKSVGCHPQNVRLHRDAHPDFDELCVIALEEYRNQFIEAARLRAVDGFQNPIIGGRNRDEVVAYKREYSDRLLELFLKRSADGSFTENQNVTVETKQTVDYRSLSKEARAKLREACTQVKMDKKSAQDETEE